MWHDAKSNPDKFYVAAWEEKSETSPHSGEMSVHSARNDSRDIAARSHSSVKRSICARLASALALTGDGCFASRVLASTLESVCPVSFAAVLRVICALLLCFFALFSKSTSSLLTCLANLGRGAKFCFQRRLRGKSEICTLLTGQLDNPT